MLDPALELVLRGALALLLGTGAVQKARDLASFRAAIEGYELLPARAATIAACAFTGLEAALGLALVVPLGLGLRGLALGAVALLFTLYGTAIAINLARGRRTLECGCAPSAYRQPLSEWLLVRNLALIGVAALTLLPVSSRAWRGWIG